MNGESLGRRKQSYYVINANINTQEGADVL